MAGEGGPKIAIPTLGGDPMVGFPMGRNDCNLIQEDKYGAKALTTGNSSVYEYNFSKEASMYKTDEGVNWRPYLTRIVVK